MPKVVLSPALTTEASLPKFNESLRKVAPFLNIGGMFSGCMVVGVGLGYWLDIKLDTAPWLLLAGSMLGIVSGFYHFFKIVGRLGKNNGNDHER